MQEECQSAAGLGTEAFLSVDPIDTEKWSFMDLYSLISYRI